jgi:hypothetical protein
VVGWAHEEANRGSHKSISGRTRRDGFHLDTNAAYPNSREIAKKPMRLAIQQEDAGKVKSILLLQAKANCCCYRFLTLGGKKGNMFFKPIRRSPRF